MTTINYDLMKTYAPSGTHMGGALATGSGFLSGANNASFQGVQSSDFMFESFMPSADTNAFNVNGISVAAGASQYLPLSNYGFVNTVSIPYLQKVQINNTYAIKLDYPRSFQIQCNQPFTVMISGFDRYEQKTNMQGIVTTPVSGVYTYQMVRCLSYLTAIYVTNNGGSAANFTVNMNQTIEMPFWNVSTDNTTGAVTSDAEGALAPLLDIKYFRATAQRSLYYWSVGNTSTSGPVFNTTALGIQGINAPIPNTSPSIFNPLTLTTGTPRVWLLLAAPFTTFFPFDQQGMLTTYYNASNLFINSQPTYDYNFTELSSIIGPKNYFDSNWSGWQG